MAQYRHDKGDRRAQARAEAVSHQSRWLAVMLAVCFLLLAIILMPGAKAAPHPATPESNRIKDALSASGHFGEVFQMAMDAYNEGEIPAAMQMWESLALSGHAPAQYNLGVAYARGIVGKADMGQAYRWWQAAARQGNSDAQYNLGLLYATGNGVEQSMEKAVHWWQQAARIGDAAAQFNLGMMYARGDGVDRNMDAAMHWWSLSAAQEFPQAKQLLNELNLTR